MLRRLFPPCVGRRYGVRLFCLRRRWGRWFVGIEEGLLVTFSLLSLDIGTRHVGNDSAMLPITRRATRQCVGRRPSTHIAIANKKANMNVSTLVSGAASVTVTSHPVGFDRGVGVGRTKRSMSRVVMTCSTLTMIMRPSGPIGRLAHRRLRSVFHKGVAG